MVRTIDLSQEGITEQRQIIDIFLQPGQFHWGDRFTRIHTILGSCVSVCLIHRELRIGGMNHIQMPGTSPSRGKDRLYPAKYSDDAMLILMQEIEKLHLPPEAFVAKVFGGGCLLQNESSGVGRRNFDSVLRFLDDVRIPVVARDLGGTEHRRIVFDIAAGDVWVKKHIRSAIS